MGEAFCLDGEHRTLFIVAIRTLKSKYIHAISSANNIETNQEVLRATLDSIKNDFEEYKSYSK